MTRLASPPPHAKRLNDTESASDAATTVRTMDYEQLRVMAECTPVLGKTEGRFNFSAAGLHWARDPVSPTVAPGQTAASTGPAVVVPAWNVGRYPPNEVVLTVAEGPVSTLGRYADAVFWTEAAVEKFVFPYLASCGGPRAAQALESLQRVWNRFPSDQLTVFAVMHRVDPHESLTLGNSFVVAYVEHGTDGGTQTHVVGALPLESFDSGTWNEMSETDPYREVPLQPTVPGVVPDYLTLRSLAEYASSYRDAAMYFVLNPGQTELAKPRTESEVQVQANSLVIPVYTPPVRDDRPPLQEVRFIPPVLTAQGTAVELPLNTVGDAVFWSTGAIEQFMFPYYASKRGFASPVELQEIQKVWDPEYTPPSAPTQHASATPAAGTVAAAESGTQGLEEAGTEEPEVYGLVHMPRSAWVTVDEAAAMAELDEEELRTLRKYVDEEKKKHAAATMAAPLPGHRETGVLHVRASGRGGVLPLDYFKVLFANRFR